MNTTGEIREQRPHGEAAATGVDRNTVGISNERACGVGDEAGEVVALTEDRTARGARHHPTHVLADLIEPVLHQSKNDGVARVPATLRRRRRNAHGRVIGRNFDHEVAGGIDRQAIARPQQHRGRSLLDDGGPGNAVTHAEVGAVVDGGFEPAMLVVPDRSESVGLARALAGACFYSSGLGRPRRSSGRDTQRCSHDHAIRLNVTIEALILRLECAPGVGWAERFLCQGHTKRPELSAVMQIDRALEIDLVGSKALGPQRRMCLIGQLGQLAVDMARLELVQLALDVGLEILPYVRVQHPDRAQGAGITGHVDPPASEPARDVGAMHGARAARRHQSEPARRIPALDGDIFDGVQQVLLEHRNDAGSRVLERQAERLGDAAIDGPAGRVLVESQTGGGIGAGTQPAEHELRVGDSRLGAAKAIARRPRTGARPLRADVEHAGGIDAGNGSAARSNGVDVDRRDRDVIAGDHQVVLHRHLAARHQHDVARGAADLHRDEIAGVFRRNARAVDRMAVVVQRADSGGRPAQQQIDRPRRDLVD